MIDQDQQAELNQALELFHFAFRSFTRHPDQILAERGLQRVHHRILYFVGRNPQLSVNGLLRILGVSKQALNGPLRRLQELGLVSAVQAEQDRRSKQLSLTAEGEALEDQLSGCQRALMAQVFAQLGPDAEQHWRAIMATLAQWRWPEVTQSPFAADQVGGLNPAAPQSASDSNSALPTPHSGQRQSGGTASQGVPGGSPSSGTPLASS